MTHEELVEELDFAAKCCEGFTAYILAVRAVVELHKPLEFSRYCAYCVPTENYPCKTIQIIEKELA